MSDTASSPSEAAPSPEMVSEVVQGISAPADAVDLSIEAALFTTDRPLAGAKLAEVVGAGAGKDVAAAVERLNQSYEQTGRSFRIEAVAGGWQMMTLPRFAPVLAALHKTRSQSRLTPAALETLAIIAYKQPVLRAEIEAIRGVSCGEGLRGLMERRLVKIAGRAEEIGRPMLYGTTKTFLEVFGLTGLGDLPKVEELKAPAK